MLYNNKILQSLIELKIQKYLRILSLVLKYLTLFTVRQSVNFPAKQPNRKI